MTPDINSIIESTIALQQSTNRLQLLTLLLILICDVFIVLSVINIRKTMRINKEWTANLQAWTEALSRRDSDGNP